ncbi:MAG: hypothetical protein JNK46_16730 [Methylobacteriaceae bacterium]|nr:hypothetical protein [Methylobacteriaceae bacterium]
MRVLLLCLALLAAAPAAAQTAEPPASDNGRYAMTPTADGFLRLDTRSGKVSLCTTRDGAAQCRAAADEREAWEREIADLRRQVAELKAGRTGSGPTLRLPNEQEVDQALGVMERILRRLGRILRDEPQGAPL